MKSNKLRIENLKVQSFVTSMQDESVKTIKGGETDPPATNGATGMCMCPFTHTNTWQVDCTYNHCQ